MIWLRRSFVLVPIGAFLIAALLLSCGGGGGGGTQNGAGLPFSISSLSICAGPPVTRTPTPEPTHLKCATPTPIKFTPQCTPIGIPPNTPMAVGTNADDNILELNAQQTIQQNTNTKRYYEDITGNLSVNWNITSDSCPPNHYCVLSTPLSSPFPPGELPGVAPGCACVTVQVANIVSCPVLVRVASPVSTCTPCAAPPLCPGPIPTPTRTPKARPTCTPTATATATATATP